ncbi:hypothetical protein SAY86_026951 [Trapa natans]|uniref:DUF3741 domain-containing protein n=1 Tax=Trapa natans TaxID=22666 RepID=A0AAN7KSQ9_TRANT|nr:hypothetical protein SAY86_026951 [Trapa natans]
MAKPTQRRSVRYDQTGCMWGLIRILDFCHARRSTQKLLAGKRHESRLLSDVGDLGVNHKLSIDHEENLVGTLGDEERFQMAVATDSPTYKTNMKMLIEEEMVNKQHTGDKISDPNLYSEHVVGKSNCKRSKKSRGSLDKDTGNLNGIHKGFNYSKLPCNHTPDEGLINKQNHDEVILEEFCNPVNQRGVTEVPVKMKPNKVDLEVKENLHDAIKKFIDREVANEKDIRENGRVNFSKEVVDALQIRDLNEESFLKLLQDPNLLSMSNAGTLNSCKDNELKDFESVCHSHHNSSKQNKFYRKHMKFQAKPSEKERKRPDTNTVVILKSGPNALKSYAAESETDTLSDSSHCQRAERERTYFLTTEIKKMWKHLMGNEHNADKDHFFTEKIMKPRDPNVSIVMENAGKSKQWAPNIYIEAKRHLPEMLSSGYEEVDSLGTESRRTLARILALSEFNSPIPSPVRNLVQSFVAAHTRFSGDNDDQFGQVSANVKQNMVENNGSYLSSSAKGTEPEPINTMTCHVVIEEEARPASGEDMTSDGGYLLSHLITLNPHLCDMNALFQS